VKNPPCGESQCWGRSKLVALTVADLTDPPDGLRVLIRHSKTDQEGQGLRSPPMIGRSPWPDVGHFILGHHHLGVAVISGLSAPAGAASAVTDGLWRKAEAFACLASLLTNRRSKRLRTPPG
jgi:hypothetical protein